MNKKVLSNMLFLVALVIMFLTKSNYSHLVGLVYLSLIICQALIYAKSKHRWKIIAPMALIMVISIFAQSKI